MRSAALNGPHLDPTIFCSLITTGAGLKPAPAAQVDLSTIVLNGRVRLPFRYVSTAYVKRKDDACFDWGTETCFRQGWIAAGVG